MNVVHTTKAINIWKILPGKSHGRDHLKDEKHMRVYNYYLVAEKTRLNSSGNFIFNIHGYLPHFHPLVCLSPSILSP